MKIRLFGKGLGMADAGHLPGAGASNDQYSLCQSYLENSLESNTVKASAHSDSGSSPRMLTLYSRAGQPLNYLSRLSPDLSSLDYNVISEINRSSSSRPNFAWRLARYFYNNDEMRGRNCFGRKGKKAICSKKLNMIHKLVFEYFPLGSEDSAKRMWSDCTVAIDKGIRNTIHGHYMKSSSSSQQPSPSYQSYLSYVQDNQPVYPQTSQTDSQSYTKTEAEYP